MKANRPPCEAPDCNRPVLGQGRWCSRHAQRMRVWGALEPPDPPIPQDAGEGVGAEALDELKAEAESEGLDALAERILKRGFRRR